MRLPLSALALALGLASPLRAGSPAVDIGAGVSTQDQFVVHVSAGWTRGDLYQAAKVRFSTEVFPSALPGEHAGDFSFQAGPCWNHSFAFAAVSAGLSVLQFEDRIGPGRPNPDCDDWDFFCPDSIHASKESMAVGLPVEVLFSLKLWYVGLGFRAWGNVNTHRPMAGIGSVLFLGGGPTRTRARRPPD